MKTVLMIAAAASVGMLRGSDVTPPMTHPYGLVIHGGAGVILRNELPPDLEVQYRATLTEARDTGYAVLQHGGTALDAVVATIRVMEDSPLFNAGKGAVMNADGVCEMDASIMDGRTLAAGAVAGVRHVRNPIQLARAVMEKSDHVLLSGDGAEKFAKEVGFDLLPNEYFQTDFRRKQLEKAKERENPAARKSAQAGTMDRVSVATVDENYLINQLKHGTVGCVALDQNGNLAAGTSTGGMTNKKFGRIGDSPIIGAGTYANNATCAVSCTGWGEYFIRLSVAHDIAAQVEYRRVPLGEAAAATIAKVGKIGGDGGVICIDRAGNIAMPFNTAGMYRGWRLSSGGAGIEIFGAEAGK